MAAPTSGATGSETATGTDGTDALDGPATPPVGGPRAVKRGPALVVVGIVAVIGVGGFALAAIGGRPGSSAPPATARRLPGVALSAVPASGVLRSIARSGEPPRDIAGALVVPVGTRQTGHSCPPSVELYDCTVHLAVAARPSEVVAFYRAELRHEGWTVLAVDATTGSGTEIYAQRGSNDGFYWEVGVRVDSATPSITPALSGGGQTAPTSTVSLRVLERNDPD